MKLIKQMWRQKDLSVVTEGSQSDQTSYNKFTTINARLLFLSEKFYNLRRYVKYTIASSLTVAFWLGPSLTKLHTIYLNTMINARLLFLSEK